ncbi:hypothetical protein [Microbacterium enclense]|uniref:hypothetical protein n=1 Tax=Microbacterium enclense TaxID=993073 RepID=UPI003418AECF
MPRSINSFSETGDHGDRVRYFSGGGIAARHWFRRRGWTVDGLRGVDSLELVAREMRMDGIVIRTLRYGPVTMHRSPASHASNVRTLLLIDRGAGTILLPTRRMLGASSTVVLPHRRSFQVRMSAPGELVEVVLAPKGGVWSDDLGVSVPGAAASAASALARALLAGAGEVKDAEVAHLSLAMEFAASGAGISVVGPPGNASLAHRADAMIRRNAHDPNFTVDSLARALRVSRRHLTRTLTNAGRSPRARLREVRVAYAQAMIGSVGTAVLRDDGQARMCGFASARALRDALSRAATPPMGASPEHSGREP